MKMNRFREYMHRLVDNKGIFNIDYILKRFGDAFRLALNKERLEWLGDKIGHRVYCRKYEGAILFSDPVYPKVSPRIISGSREQLDYLIKCRERMESRQMNEEEYPYLLQTNMELIFLKIAMTHPNSPNNTTCMFDSTTGLKDHAVVKAFQDSLEETLTSPEKDETQIAPLIPRGELPPRTIRLRRGEK